MAVCQRRIRLESTLYKYPHKDGCLCFWRLSCLCPLLLVERTARTICRRIFWLSGAFVVAYGVYYSGLLFIFTRIHLIATPIIAIFFASMVYLSINSQEGQGVFGAIRSVLRTTFLGFLGKYSYGIYVYHWIVWITLIRLDAFNVRTTSPWGNTLLAAFVTLGIALMSYHLLELPFLRMKGWLVGRLQNLGKQPPYFGKRLGQIEA